jgi:hypothetical protein
MMIHTPISDGVMIPWHSADTARNSLQQGVWGVVVLMFLLLSVPQPIFAQPISPKAVSDSKGKEFFIAFPPNVHATNGSQFDKLVIAIGAERPTRGTIRYIDRNDQNRQISFVISNPSEVYRAEIPFQEAELWEVEEPTRRGVMHITADEEVSLYGASIASQTSDAFLAFPTDVLGRDHVIISYPSDAQRPASARTPSQAVVIAVEDDTEVTLVTTATIQLARSTVRLRRGQAYLIRASVFSTSALPPPNRDLTGVRVLSNKPVAVLGSHERASVPVDVPNASRDFLIEQITPVETWGQQAFVVPYPTPLSGLPSLRRDVFRVVAAFDSTVVRINGSTVATLQAGDFVESLISTSAQVQASQPVAVMGYKASESGGAVGDPFMALFPPAEQFLPRYRFVSVQGQQFRLNANNSTESAFIDHYVSVVIPSTKASTVVLDGRPIQARQFTRIANSDYAFANISIGDGIHSITADTTFGITAIGYGSANSYGYIGGQRFETDRLPPRLFTRRTCTGVEAVLRDDLFTDSRLFWVDVGDFTGVRPVNARVSVGAFPRPADSVTIRADLINPYEDGSFEVFALDSLEQRTRARVVVPGLTVHARADLRGEQTVRLSTNAIALAAGVERCFTMNLVNYGSTTQTLTNLEFARSRTSAMREFYVNTTLPIVLAPRQQRAVNVCFRSDRNGIFSDTVLIDNGCVQRRIAVMEVESGFDREAPTLQRLRDSCNQRFVFAAADKHQYASGVALVRVVAEETQNCLLQSVRKEDFTLETTLQVLNPRKDAFYTLVVQDSVGNERRVRDTLQGFTLRFEAAPGRQPLRKTPINQPLSQSGTVPTSPQEGLSQRIDYTFSTTNATSVTCETVRVFNDGALPYTLTPPVLLNNTLFSFPQAQFPLRIPPQSFRELALCFAPALVQRYRDTLQVGRGCITDMMILTGDGGYQLQTPDSRCRVAVSVTPTFGRTDRGERGNNQAHFVVSHFPEPASQTLTLRVETDEPATLWLKLYSALGVAVVDVQPRALPQGQYDVALDVSTLEAGVYVYEVRTLNAVKTGLLRVVR